LKLVWLGKKGARERVGLMDCMNIVLRPASLSGKTERRRRSERSCLGTPEEKTGSGRALLDGVTGLIPLL